LAEVGLGEGIGMVRRRRRKRRRRRWCYHKFHDHLTGSSRYLHIFL